MRTLIIAFFIMAACLTGLSFAQSSGTGSSSGGSSMGSGSSGTASGPVGNETSNTANSGGY